MIKKQQQKKNLSDISSYPMILNLWGAFPLSFVIHLYFKRDITYLGLGVEYGLGSVVPEFFKAATGATDVA